MTSPPPRRCSDSYRARSCRSPESAPGTPASPPRPATSPSSSSTRRTRLRTSTSRWPPSTCSRADRRPRSYRGSCGRRPASPASTSPDRPGPWSRAPSAGCPVSFGLTPGRRHRRGCGHWEPRSQGSTRPSPASSTRDWAARSAGTSPPRATSASCSDAWPTRSGVRRRRRCSTASAAAEGGASAAEVLARFARAVAPALAHLPSQAIHNDANDLNVLVDPADPDQVVGLLDFGDLCLAPRVCGLAVACAYAVAASASAGATQSLIPPDSLIPLDSLITGRRVGELLPEVVAGYHGVAPLTAGELALLPDLLRTRLALSVVMAGWQHADDPGNDYLLVSQAGVRATLEALPRDGDDLLLFRLRAACGYEPVPRAG